MDAAERLCAAVLPIVPICYLHDYDGEAEIYCTWQCGYDGAVHGDDAAGAVVQSFLLDLYLPAGKNPRQLLRQLCRAIEAAGFTGPSVEDGTVDRAQQHYVLLFEGMDDDG